MLDRERIFSKDNLLRLSNPANFQNTASMANACYFASNWCRDLNKETVLVEVQPSYFSGYVFRTDCGNPGEILENGFPFINSRGRQEELHRRLFGAKGGSTLNCGISTSICASFSSYSSMLKVPVTLVYGHNRNLSSYTYLIDATEYKGFAIPSSSPLNPIVMQFPYLREICEVNFPNMIPNFKIVGIVFPEKIGHSSNTYWPARPSRLMLAVNPHYSASFEYGSEEKKGLEAARVVVERFNKKR